MKEQIKQQKSSVAETGDLVKQIKELIKEQQAQNKLIRDEYNEIKTQNMYLRDKNEIQESELAKDKNWQLVAWIITTIIAVGAIVVPLIDLIHNW